MRVQHWITILVGVVVLALGERQHVLAQNGPGAYLSAPAAPPGGFSSSLQGPEYGSYPAVIPPAVPAIGGGIDGSTINPYPAISPFDKGLDKYFNSHGLWDNVQHNTDRHYYSNVDLLFMYTSQARGVFGSPSAQSYVRQERDFINGASSSGGTGGTGTGSGSDATSQLLINQGFMVNTPAQIASEFNYYDRVGLDDLSSFFTVGARFQLGYWNADETGFAGTFWFGGKASNTFNGADVSTQQQKNRAELIQVIRALQSGVLPPGSPIDDLTAFIDLPGNLSPSQIMQQNLLNLRGLPVNDGTTRGQTIPYDIFFGIKTTSEQVGTSLDYYLTPIYQQKWLTVHPTVGVQYLNVHETLSFLGLDSGLLYSSSGGSSGSTAAGNRDFKAQSIPNGIDDDKNGIVDDAATPEPGPSSSSSGTGGGTGGSSSALFVGPSPFTLLPATINISTNTNLVGPDAGLRYMMGSPSLHLTGESKFGLMANIEHISLSGNNIGSTTRVNGQLVNFPTEITASTQTNPRPETQQDLIIPTPQNPNPNAFQDSQTHVHVSPLLSQSLFLEGRVFQYVPVVKHIWPLDTANFRAGFTVIYVGDFISTNNSVIYNGDPMANLFPKISVQHENWWTTNWSLGMSWDF